jgi:hypothetical protein
MGSDQSPGPAERIDRPTVRVAPDAEDLGLEGGKRGHEGGGLKWKVDADAGPHGLIWTCETFRIEPAASPLPEDPATDPRLCVAARRRQWSQLSNSDLTTPKAA